MLSSFPVINRILSVQMSALTHLILGTTARIAKVTASLNWLIMSLKTTNLCSKKENKFKVLNPLEHTAGCETAEPSMLCC
jgi:hypothetical protein